MSRTLLLKQARPAEGRDSAGNFHVYPKYVEGMGPKHEMNPFCWCFPEVHRTDPRGKPLAHTLYIHHVFPKRGEC